MYPVFLWHMTDTQSELYACLAFSHTSGIGPITFKKLYSAFGSAYAAYTAKPEELKSHFHSHKTFQFFLTFRENFRADRIQKHLVNKDIHMHHISSSKYPKRFRTLYAPPICLYTKGDTHLLNSTIPILGIIGSRKPSPYGLEMTRQFVTSLSSYNLIILSGLAFGIDSQAHIHALKHHIPTISVLGSGYNHVHPKANLGLYEKIIEEDGLVITEYPPDTPASSGTFPARNRLIAGLCDALLIIEGNEQSGTRITASHALDNGTDIFALPGHIDSHLSWTPHYLIQNGAYLVHSPQNIIDHLNLSPKRPTSDHSQAILGLLSTRPASAEDIACQLNLDLPTMTAELTLLELSGHICQSEDNLYLLQ